MGGRAWLDSVRGVTQSRARLSARAHTLPPARSVGVGGDGGRLPGPEGGLGTPRQQAPAVATCARAGGACPETDDQSGTAAPGPWRRNSVCPPHLMTRVSGPQVGAARPAAPGKCWKQTDSETLGVAEAPNWSNWCPSLGTTKLSEPSDSGGQTIW